MSNFTLIEGFNTLEDARKKIDYLFPNIGAEGFDFYKIQNMYYAVTMRGVYIQIVVSKDFIRCRMPDYIGLFETDKLNPQRWKWQGIYGGSSRWDDSIIYDAENALGTEEMVYSGKNTGGPNRKHWANNTHVLLNLLFADKTRNNDDATY